MSSFFLLQLKVWLLLWELEEIVLLLDLEQWNSMPREQLWLDWQKRTKELLSSCFCSCNAFFASTLWTFFIILFSWPCRKEILWSYDHSLIEQNFPMHEALLHTSKHKTGMLLMLNCNWNNTLQARTCLKHTDIFANPFLDDALLHVFCNKIVLHCAYIHSGFPTIYVATYITWTLFVIAEGYSKLYHLNSNMQNTCIQVFIIAYNVHGSSVWCFTSEETEIKIGCQLLHLLAHFFHFLIDLVFLIHQFLYLVTINIVSVAIVAIIAKF